MDHPSFPATTTTPLEYSLFSPSKAAEQQRLAKDWTYIHSFLRRKYPTPSRVPKFEENEETLNALLALAAANEKADEGWSGKQDTNDINTTILNNFQSSLSKPGASDLLTHATASITLTSPSTSPTSLATHLLNLTTSLFSLTQQLSQTTSLQTSLQSQSSHLQSDLRTMTSASFTPEPNLPKRTSETLRQTKLLKAKIAEYDERLRNSSSSIPEPLLMEVEQAGKAAEVLMQKLADVEGKIAIYEGVSPEPREVRRQMQDLRRELEMWVRRRDELFEGLVGGEEAEEGEDDIASSTLLCIRCIVGMTNAEKETYLNFTGCTFDKRDAQLRIKG
ncbi:unnamed protein product [Aureobasidium pullulans]|nr:unnamed protein product [Aureobasidium pullulans]